MLADIAVGTKLPTVTKSITADRIATFESCSAAMMDQESHTSIHTDPAAAQRAGLDAPIASGMMTTAYLTEMLRDYFGDAWITSGHLRVSFIGSVRAGDTVTARGVVVAPPEDLPADSQDRLALEVWCERGDGKKVTVGSADVAVYL